MLRKVSQAGPITAVICLEFPVAGLPPIIPINEKEGSGLCLDIQARFSYFGTACINAAARKRPLFKTETMKYRRIPDETIRRMPQYLRAAISFERRGIERVSSRDLTEEVGISPWQIRKDLSYFGGFGTRGVGYDTKVLRDRLKQILGLDEIRPIALVGVGNLGAALMQFGGFAKYGLQIVAAFDVDPKKVGTRVSGIEIEPVERLGNLGERGIDLGIISVPGKAAQDTADLLVKSGVRGILSFSSTHVVVPDKVKIIVLDIAMDLACLPFYLTAGEAPGLEAQA